MLKELKQKESKLLNEIREVRKLIKYEELSDVFNRYGVKIGSIVESKGYTYEVTGIRPFSLAYKPSLYGRKQKKDGGFSKNAMGIYGDWEVVK